jgi:putative DNA primase/helicase
MTSTADKVLAALAPYELSKVGPGEYRCNSPFRPDSNSHAFAVKIEGPEHGTFFDHVSDEGGSLYGLADHLGIAPPAMTTKRHYGSLDEYAAAHNVTGDVFRRAGWVEVTYTKRPALKFATASGDRWRFLDGGDPPYINAKGYKRCWYGLGRAIGMARRLDMPLVLCNGEASVVAAQAHDFPAACVTSGEKGTLPADLLDHLRGAWNGEVVVAFDCDKKGVKAGTELAAFLRASGFRARAVDMQGGVEGYDLADFAGSHTAAALFECPPLDTPTQPATWDDLPPPPPPEYDTVADPGSLLRFEATDEGNAEAVWSLHGRYFRYVEEWGWLHYTGTHWTTEGAAAALGFAVVETLRERRKQAVDVDNEKVIKCAKPDQARVRACIAALQKHADARVTEFDQSPHLLNCSNGVVNLRTGALFPHAEVSEQFTYCLSTAYDPDADYSVWLDFLIQVVGGGGEVISWLQEAVGYSITGETREECLFYTYGPPRSGKGTFSETLETLLESPLAVEMDFKTFVNEATNADSQNFALAPLKPSRMVFASEVGEYQTLNGARLKALTGGNPIHCAFKGKDFFTYKPRFKIWLSANPKPRASVDDDAIWSRLRVIEFPVSHVGKEDKMLKLRMASPEILRGVLAWAIEGARLWYSAPKGLVTPDAVTLATSASRAELDTIQLWLDEYTQVDPGGWADNNLLYASYENWCKSNGHKPRNAANLGRALETKGFVGERYTANGTTRRRRLGLILVDGSAPTPPPANPTDVDF